MTARILLALYQGWLSASVATGPGAALLAHEHILIRAITGRYQFGSGGRGSSQAPSRNMRKSCLAKDRASGRGES
ncbi:MAG: hypothetical protein NZ899_05325 [Thermoguttaceae bacterium]|nr:hypothetical protein [Thermoguttaceae bacterium]MDW8078262.1 hypothetical protein [Thermoguttaceae bacterium]